MKKKLFLTILTLLVALVLVACAKTTHLVTFNSNGGSDVAAVEVIEGERLVSPNDPTREDYIFAGWFEKEDLSGEPYDFDKVVTAPFTLYAKWLLNEETAQFIRFVDHRLNTTNVVVANEAGVVAKPTDPTRAGYRFGGWFTTKRGLTWTETAPFDFSQVVPEGGKTLYAYWEPINSKTQNWSADETYYSTLSSTVPMTFNPLNYEYADELAIVQNMATLLYFQEVDWDKAIEDGIADFPGDFSKIGVTEGKFGIDLLKNHYVLGGAAAFPKDQNGHDLVDENGKWDRDAASQFRDTKWVITLRNDLKFENGDPITAEDYVYTYLQYIDPLQNNKRGSTLFPTQDRRNGYPVVNSRAYFLTPDHELFQYEVDNNLFTGEIVDGKVTADSVGFKAISDYEIEITFETPQAQTAAVGLMNSIYLVHKPSYEASLDTARENSSYGTILHPYVSYGGYIIKSWDENQKLIFNKNYDYVLKGTINYKSISYQYTDGIETNMQLFKNNLLSAVGLQGDYAAEYAEWKNNYPTYNGYPMSFEINITDSLDGERPAHDALKDVNFRKAILFGFDRQEFANTVGAPNMPSIMIWPIEAKQYADDEFWYKDTPEHKTLLEDLGIDEQTAGYDETKAIQYFNLAYDAWVAKGNTGPIVLNYVVNDSDAHKRYAKYIEQHFEELFGKDKLDIQQEVLNSTILFERTDARKFDLAFDTSGWGFGDAAYVYMPLKGLYYTWLFGDDAGMNSLEAFDGLADEVFEDLDLRNIYQYLLSTKYEREEDEDTPSGFWDEETAGGTTLEFFEILDENEGYFSGEALDLFYFLVYDDFIFVTATEPFPGAVADLTRITAAYERLILEYVTLVPVGSSTSVVAYAMNVKIEWPYYSYELAWGTARYRHLTTDPDFAA